jgi:hypothetical protein
MASGVNPLLRDNDERGRMNLGRPQDGEGRLSKTYVFDLSVPPFTRIV